MNDRIKRMTIEIIDKMEYRMKERIIEEREKAK